MLEVRSSWRSWCESAQIGACWSGRRGGRFDCLFFFSFELTKVKLLYPNWYCNSIVFCSYDRYLHGSSLVLLEPIWPIGRTNATDIAISSSTSTTSMARYWQKKKLWCSIENHGHSIPQHFNSGFLGQVAFTLFACLSTTKSTCVCGKKRNDKWNDTFS